MCYLFICLFIYLFIYFEDNEELVPLTTDHVKSDFQGFNNAAEVARNLSTEFNNKIHHIRKDYDNEKIVRNNTLQDCDHFIDSNNMRIT